MTASRPSPHPTTTRQNVSLNSDNPVLRLTRAGGTLEEELPGTDWTVFTPADTTYIPLEWAAPAMPHYSEERLILAILVRETERNTHRQRQTDR